MRARGHLAGGALAGGGVAAAATALGYVPGIDHALWWAVVATTLFFSLFPDVDTDSLPRRWFYRGVLAALLWLAWQRRFEQATLLASAAVLPLVDHHRGWTHGRYTPLLAVLLVGGLLWGLGVMSQGVGPGCALAPGHLALTAAAVAGWYTHLLLDGLFRIFPQDPL